MIHRHRSVSMPKPADWDLETEAEYYHRKAFERAALGEAKDGATKDWGLVDVPPGTNKVRMEGIGGGAQEITWQRYNGARRSKFIADGKEYVSEYGPAPPALPPPPKPKPADMWTEVTKDLVIKEAIEAMGYDYEETDNYFYVMEYLRYVGQTAIRILPELTTCRRTFFSLSRFRTTFAVIDASASARLRLSGRRSSVNRRCPLRLRASTITSSAKSSTKTDEAATAELDNAHQPLDLLFHHASCIFSAGQSVSFACTAKTIRHLLASRS